MKTAVIITDSAVQRFRKRIARVPAVQVRSLILQGFEKAQFAYEASGGKHSGARYLVPPCRTFLLVMELDSGIPYPLITSVYDWNSGSFRKAVRKLYGRRACGEAVHAARRRWRPRSNRKWSDGEVQWVADHAHYLTEESMAAKLGRSVEALKDKMRRLRLYPQQQDYLTLSEAARETGYSRDYLLYLARARKIAARRQPGRRRYIIRIDRLPEKTSAAGARKQAEIPPGWVLSGRAAEITGYSQQYLVRLAKRGRLSYAKRLSCGALVFRESSLAPARIGSGEAARRLGVSQRHAERLARRGNIPASRDGSGCWVFRLPEVKAFAEERA
ncbi:MAG TPA: helix-turn-helix domain-containing protein [Acidobacteriota bacterium]|nr:helix-turn-helix domain-containing protein [Acidobacteriota bacterium]